MVRVTQTESARQRMEQLIGTEATDSKDKTEKKLMTEKDEQPTFKNL